MILDWKLKKDINLVFNKNDPPFNATTPARNSNGYSINFLIKIIENPRTIDVYEPLVYWQSSKAIL